MPKHPVGFSSFGYKICLINEAVKGVNRFGWGEAIGSLFIPALIIGFVCGCPTIAGLAVLGTALRDVFQQIQQGIQ